MKLLTDSDNEKKEFKRSIRGNSQQKGVEAIMVRDVVTITPENTLYEAAKIMGEKHIGSLIVFKYETPVGIITERDLLREVVEKGIALEKDWLAGGASIKEEKVEKIMSYPLIAISANSSIKEAAQIMIEKKIRRVIVSEPCKVVGIVTASDLIRSLPEAPEAMSAWFEVDYFMSKSVITADEETLVEDVAIIMGQKSIGSVIITSHGKHSGIFTERDLLTKFLAKNQSLKVEVGKSCSSPLITAPLGISVRDAAIIMTSKHIKRLPITKEKKIVGMLSARDLVEAYARSK
ncbi:CBS domain-containing protein [Candidatus Bathyarchaeota archaeon]|nr:CBS domain-containing protein [Candidatus Bathyarchaeota archaeon]